VLMCIIFHLFDIVRRYMHTERCSFLAENMEVLGISK